MRELFY